MTLPAKTVPDQNEVGKSVPFDIFGDGRDIVIVTDVAIGAFSVSGHGRAMDLVSSLP
jgi:hypothetical protein